MQIQAPLKNKTSSINPTPNIESLKKQALLRNKPRG